MTSPTDLEKLLDRLDKANASVKRGHPKYTASMNSADELMLTTALRQLLADRRELVKALSDALTGWRTCNTTYQHGDATPRFTEHERRIIELQALAASMGET